MKCDRRLGDCILQRLYPSLFLTLLQCFCFDFGQNLRVIVVKELSRPYLCQRSQCT